MCLKMQRRFGGDWVTKVLTINGDEVLTLDDLGQSVDVTCDDSDGLECLLPKDLDMTLHFGDKVYTVSITKEEYQRMVDDGVMK